MENFLPIGSVVLLKEAKKRLMIIGRVQVCEGKPYKYSGVMYPEGYLGSERLFVFNEEDIEVLYYVGMQDDEEFRFKEELIEQVKQDGNINKDIGMQ